MLKRGAIVAARIVIFLYIVCASVVAVYFNWQYARNHGLVKWILLGEIVSTWKGAAWPYYLFIDPNPPSWSDEEKQNAKHFFLSMEANIAATKILNQGAPYSEIPYSSIEETQRLLKYALEESRQVRDDVLEKALPGLSRPFRDKYQRSLESKIHGFESGDTAALIRGTLLHDEWVDWFNENRSKIRIPK